ncbi:formyltetrahydrofolate deformylase [Helicobacter sp. T3_23-1056]
MRYTLLIATNDSAGLVYQISRVLYEAGANIERQDEYVDREHNLFFLRTCFAVEFAESSGKSTHPLAPSAREGEDLESALDCKIITEIQNKLKSILPRGAHIALKTQAKKSLIILATKENHCLGDLLLREESGELNAQIKAVIANRNDLASLVERFAIPFFWVDSDGVSPEAHEAKLREIIDRFSPDLLALAKYMRILSPDFVAHYAGKIINIHHSFLPAFVGANPYKQAHKRGVKIIGATAHFVTDMLDEGPIIAQDIIHINHTYSWRDMQKAGRDVEKSVFAHALDLVLHDRVFVSGNKTIVF